MSTDLERLLQATAVHVHRPLDPAVLRSAVGRRRARRIAGSTGLLLAMAVAGANLIGLQQAPHLTPTITTPGEREEAPSRVERPSVEDHTVDLLGSGPHSVATDAWQIDGTRVDSSWPDGPRPAGATASDPTPWQSDVPPPTTTLAFWDFNEGFDGWTDGRGFEEMGFMAAGQPVSTQEQDPRRGWQLDPEGRDGTTAVRGRRINGAVNGKLSSPWTTITQTPAGISVDLWYRWHAKPDPESLDRFSVDIHLWGNDGTDIVVGELRQDHRTSPGVWSHYRIGIPVDEHVFGDADMLQVYLTSHFPEPAEDCTSDDERGGPCDLGLTIDDVRLSTW